MWSWPCESVFIYPTTSQLLLTSLWGCFCAVCLFFFSFFFWVLWNKHHQILFRPCKYLVYFLLMGTIKLIIFKSVSVINNPKYNKRFSRIIKWFLEHCYVNFIVFKNESSALMGRVSVFGLSGGLNPIRFSVYLNQLKDISI